MYKLTRNSALNKRKVAFFCRSFLSVFVLYLFQGIFSTRLAQNLLIRKTFFKSVYISLLFIKQMLFIDLNLFFIFFFDILRSFAGIHFRATQNIRNALESKPLSSTLILLRWQTTNNKHSAHKPFHRSSSLYHLTTCESTSKCLLVMSPATDSSTFFNFLLFN